MSSTLKMIFLDLILPKLDFHRRSSSRFLNYLQIMVLGKASLHPPKNIEQDRSTALSLLSFKDAQHPISPISITTSEVLIMYLFKTRIRQELSVQLQGSIRDMARVITSYLWPQRRFPSIRRPSPTDECTVVEGIDGVSRGPAKKRLKTRYYLENQWMKGFPIGTRLFWKIDIK